MAKKEKSTDFWVYDLLKHAEISDKFSAQGSSILEIDNALKTASKSKTGNVGMPEFVGVIKDFLIVIEDKKDVALHQKYNEQNLICQETDSVKNYAVNGAVHYGVHLSQNTDCIFSDDVKRLELKNKDYANKWVYLFLKTIILQQKEKYQYGYKFNAQRMQKQTIVLPTNDKGEPNWAYMENMMKAVEMKKILQILQHYGH